MTHKQTNTHAQKYTNTQIGLKEALYSAELAQASKDRIAKTGCVTDPADGLNQIFVKKQQAPPAGQDAVRLLYKEHVDATPTTIRKMMLQQLQEAPEGSFLPYPCDGLIFTPCTASYVLGMDKLLCKWQPRHFMAIDVQLEGDCRVSPTVSHCVSPIEQRVRELGGDVDLHGAPDVCGVTLECLPKYEFFAHFKKFAQNARWKPLSVRWDKERGNGTDALRALFSWHQRYEAAQSNILLDMLLDMQAHIPALVKPFAFTHPARLMPFAEVYSRANEAVEGGTVEKWLDPAGSGIEIFNYITCAENDDAFESTSAQNMCRGLVLHPKSSFVLATPFVRFLPQFKPSLTSSEAAATIGRKGKEIMTASMKIDGSLVVAFVFGGSVLTATRRRMDSEQALWASSWIESNGIGAHLEAGWTYMFEVVCDINRVVVHYNFEGLVLLGAVGPTGTALASGSDELFDLAAKLGVICPPSIKDTADVLCRDLPIVWSSNSSGPEGWVFQGHDGSMHKWVAEEYMVLYANEYMQKSFRACMCVHACVQVRVCVFVFARARVSGV